VQAEAEEPPFVHRRYRARHDARRGQPRVADPAEEVGRQIIDRRACRLHHALDRAIEAADEAHAGALQERVGLGQQSAEDDQVAPVVALADRRQEGARLAGGDGHRQQVIALQPADGVLGAAQLLPIQSRESSGRH
jgi:hypothetical protein